MNDVFFYMFTNFKLKLISNGAIFDFLSCHLCHAAVLCKETCLDILLFFHILKKTNNLLNF